MKRYTQLFNLLTFVAADLGLRRNRLLGIYCILVAPLKLDHVTTTSIYLNLHSSIVVVRIPDTAAAVQCPSLDTTTTLT